MSVPTLSGAEPRPPSRPPRKPVAPPSTHDPADTPKPRPIDDPPPPAPSETTMSSLDAEIARLMRFVHAPR